MAQGVAGQPVRWAEASEVRRRIACAWLGQELEVEWLRDRAPDDTEAPRVLGEIALRPHQREAVARVRVALAEFGGALLADATGLGKTYVALALAAGEPAAVIVAPAATRETWRDAMRRSAVRRPVITHERLSRGAVVGAPPLVIVDEAHHARNPGTRRYAHLATLCARARVVLLSATPVHNDSRDLEALLALFLGARAASLTPASLARCVVRRGIADAGILLPQVEATRVLTPRARPDGIVDLLLSLPPPVPPADGGEAAALLTMSLVRQWASSAGALRRALRRRLTLAAALEAALHDGGRPTAAELRAWIGGDGAVQLALPGLLASGVADATLLDAVRAHAGAVRVLLAKLDADDRRHGDADDARAALVRDVGRAHPGERVVAFTVFAETARAYYRRLAVDGGVALLTGAGARVAGGPLSRAEVMRRFAPRAHGAPEPPPAERIGMLVTTDLLSEGVNLQDASVVVHLDQPWTPARLEQRVGRVARLGSAVPRVRVYAIAPPARAEALVEMERRLRDKARAAAEPGAAPEAVERLRALMRRWADDGATGGVATRVGDAACVVAGVRAAEEGALVLCRTTTGARMLAVQPMSVTDDPCVLLELSIRAGGETARPEPRALEAVLERLRSWSGRREAARDAGVGDAAFVRARGTLVARLAAVLRRAPLHRRAEVAALAALARPAIALRAGAGAERMLGDLARAAMPDEEWLRAVAGFARRHATGAAGRAPDGGDDDDGRPTPVAVLLLVR